LPVTFAECAHERRQQVLDRRRARGDVQLAADEARAQRAELPIEMVETFDQRQR